MVIWTTVVLDLIGFGIAIPVLPRLAGDKFGLKGFWLGALLATFSLAQFVAARPMGRLSDRIGRKPLIIGSLVGTAVGSLLTAVAPAVWILFLARALDGASGASASVAQAAVGDIASPKQRAKLLGMLGAAFGIGFTVGPAIGALAAWVGDRRTPFFVAAAVAAVNAIAAVFRLPETKPAVGSAAAGSAAAGVVDGSAGGVLGAAVGGAGVGANGALTWRERGLPGLFAVMFLSGLAFSAFESTFSVFTEKRLQFSDVEAGWAFAFVGLVVTIVQGGFIGPAVKRFGELSVLRLALVATGAGMAVMTGVHGWPLLLVALLLLCLGQGLTSPAMSALTVGRIDPSRRAELLGVGQSANSAARVLGPLLGNVAFTHIGTGVPFAGGAVVFGVCAVLMQRRLA
jgi:MFS transporter, DHA1 family, tetracycline resistance protein